MSWEDAVLWLRQQPDSADLVRACFYDDPLIDAAQRYLNSSEWQAVRELLPDSRGAALDVGAGRGISAYALAKDGWDVSALEPNPSRAVGAGAIRQLASDARLNIHVVETWGEDLPFASESFDLVHCRQVLHHARDLRQLCAQLSRVLKPGGTLIATREHVLSRKHDLPAFLRSHPLHRLYGGENAYLLGEYRSALQSAGLVELRTLNPIQSNINVFPETLASIRARWARKLKLPAAVIPYAALALVGYASNAPGRLFSFVGKKPHG